MQKKKSCYRCRHYHVTWDAKFPRGCRALNFKTKFFPSDVVRSSSGFSCLYFREKKAEKSSTAKYEHTKNRPVSGGRPARRVIKIRGKGR